MSDAPPALLPDAPPTLLPPRRINQLIFVQKMPAPDQYEAILVDTGGQRYMFPVEAPERRCGWLRQAVVRPIRGEAPPQLRGEDPREPTLLQATQFGPPDKLGRVHAIRINAEDSLRTPHEIGLTVTESEGEEVIARVTFVIPVGICNQINQWLVSY